MPLAKIIRRIALVIALFIVVVIAGYFVLRSAAFHRYVIGQVNQKIQQSTGGRSEIGSYTFDLRPLVITVNRLVIHGTEPAGSMPLFQTEKVTLGLKLVSLLHGKVDLNDIQIDHPVINVVVDRNSQTNVPHPQSKSSSSTSIWDLGIQRLLIANGEIYYSSKATPLNADLHELLTRVQYDFIRQQYVGELSYRNGHLHFGTYNPIDHDLNSHFTASRSGMSFDPLILRVASSELSLRAAVQNYNQPSLSGNYRVILHTEDFRRMLRNTSLPLGTVAVAGSLSYQQIPGRSPLETFVSTGQVSSPGLALETSTLRAAVDRISGDYEVKNGDFIARNLRAALLGGELNANLSVHDVAVKRVSSLRASLKGISIQEAARALHNAQAPLSGRAQADLQANWHGSVEGLRALVNASLNAAITSSKPGVPATPLTGILHASYTGTGQTLTLTQAQLQTPASSVRMNGPIGNRSNLQIRASSSNLHELQTLALALKPAVASSPGSQASQLPSVFGTALLNATVQGSLKQPRISGQLAAQNLQVEESHWRTLQAAFTASPSEVAIQHGSLVSAGVSAGAGGSPGTIQFDADINLDDWHYLPANPLSVHLDVARMSID